MHELILKRVRWSDGGGVLAILCRELQVSTVDNGEEIVEVRVHDTRKESVIFECVGHGVECKTIDGQVAGD